MTYIDTDKLQKCGVCRVLLLDNKDDLKKHSENVHHMDYEKEGRKLFTNID